MACQEELGRLRKSVALADVIEAAQAVRQAAGLPWDDDDTAARVARRMDDAAWQLMASIADVNPPHGVETKMEVVRLLEQRTAIKAKLLKEALVDA